MNFEDIIDHSETDNHKKSNIYFLTTLELVLLLNLLFSLHGKLLFPNLEFDFTMGIISLSGVVSFLVLHLVSPYIKQPNPDFNWLWSTLYGLGFILYLIGFLLNNSINIANQVILIGLFLYHLSYLILAIYSSTSTFNSLEAKLFYWLLCFSMLLFSISSYFQFYNWSGGIEYTSSTILLAVLAIFTILISNRKQEYIHLLTYIPRLIGISILAGLTLL